MMYTSENSLDTIPRDKKKLFLAGSIDLHIGGNWRGEVAAQLKEQFYFFDPTSLNHAILDQKGWDEHVEWELLAMEMADFILLHFLPDAKSPISLIEIGLNTREGKLIVVCPKTFYKCEYVQMLCLHYSVPLYLTLDLGIHHIQKML